MTGTERRPGPIARLLIAPIRFYQRFITPYTPASCRYYPTCSAYAVTALREHGALRGSWLTLRRLGRCNPWSAGGIDRVPPRRERHRHVESSDCGPAITVDRTRPAEVLAGQLNDASIPVRSGRPTAAPTEKSTAA
jgi:uncharacterized protein